jgi:hypothetical protein
MKRMQLLALAAAIALGAAPAVAGTVFNNPSDGFACSPFCWTSTSTAGGGFQAFDDFSLGSSATIRSVTWTGFFVNSVGAGTNPPSAPSTTSWQISFSADSGGSPGAALETETISAADVHATFLGDVSGLGTTVAWYTFSAILPTSFAATGGTTYWFSTVSNQPAFNPFFSWSSDGITETNGTWQVGIDGTVFPLQERSADGRVFSLSTSAPEPGTWSLMFLGVGAIGGALRATRRTAKATA